MSEILEKLKEAASDTDRYFQNLVSENPVLVKCDHAFDEQDGTLRLGLHNQGANSVLAVVFEDAAHPIAQMLAKAPGYTSVRQFDLQVPEQEKEFKETVRTWLGSIPEFR